MTLEPLYRITFSYRESYRAGTDALLLAEGACEGRLAGRFRGANRAALLLGRLDPVARGGRRDRGRRGGPRRPHGRKVYPGEPVVLDVSALHRKPLPDEPGYDHGET
jgi:hypothetical protein